LRRSGKNGGATFTSVGVAALSSEIACDDGKLFTAGDKGRFGP
jgi:hypothetical protein